MRSHRSQCELIRLFLEDGRWHTTFEIHQHCGFSRLNSRGAELRVRLRAEGRDLVCRHVDGETSGPHAFEWRIVPLEHTPADSPQRSAGVCSSGDDDPVDPGDQLTIYEAAA